MLIVHIYLVKSVPWMCLLVVQRTHSNELFVFMRNSQDEIGGGDCYNASLEDKNQATYACLKSVSFGQKAGHYRMVCQTPQKNVLSKKSQLALINGGLEKALFQKKCFKEG